MRVGNVVLSGQERAEALLNARVESSLLAARLEGPDVLVDGRASDSTSAGIGQPFRVLHCFNVVAVELDLLGVESEVRIRRAGGGRRERSTPRGLKRFDSRKQLVPSASGGGLILLRELEVPIELLDRALGSFLGGVFNAREGELLWSRRSRSSSSFPILKERVLRCSLPVRERISFSRREESLLGDIPLGELRANTWDGLDRRDLPALKGRKTFSTSRSGRIRAWSSSWSPRIRGIHGISLVLSWI